MTDRTRKESWQVHFSFSLAGLMLHRARRSGRGEWLYGSRIPAHVRAFFGVALSQERVLLAEHFRPEEPEPTNARWLDTFSSIIGAHLAGENEFQIRQGRRDPLLLWLRIPAPHPIQAADSTSVDLKWALWSTCPGTWEEYAPGLWDRLHAAFLGHGPSLRIDTAPKKEIRYGTVTVTKGQARVHFYTYWDLPDDEEERTLAESDGRLRDDAMLGAEVSATFRARTFDRLMARIDAYETRLLHDNDRAWENWQELIRELQSPDALTFTG